MNFYLTDVQIFNKALLRLGEEAGKVFDVSGQDSSRYGVMAAQEYQSTRNEELRANNWLFAVNRVKLTPNTTATNNTGFWYVYDAPGDLLSPLMLYSVLPQFVTTYPFKHVHISPAPFVFEKGYFYTDLDNTNDNPYLKYVQQLPLGTSWAEPLFADALALRLASKLVTAVTKDVKQQIAQQLQREYAAVITRAKQKNALDIEDDLAESGNDFWTSRDMYR